MRRNIDNEIDQLFEGTDSISESKTSEVLSRLYQNMDTAEKKLHIRITSIVAIWIVAYGVHLGVFSEASLATFKATSLKPFIMAAPLMVGILFYGALSSFSGMACYQMAVQRIFKNTSKRIYENNIEFLLLPPTVFSIERAVLTNQDGIYEKLYIYWVATISVLVFSVLGGILLHLSYLLAILNDSPLWLTVCILALAWIFFARGISYYSYNGNLWMGPLRWPNDAINSDAKKLRRSCLPLQLFVSGYGWRCGYWNQVPDRSSGIQRMDLRQFFTVTLFRIPKVPRMLDIQPEFR
jgi:hypothetical protein